MVTDYNKKVLANSSKFIMKITAIDIPPSDISDKFREHLLAAISKCKPEKTGGLASSITVAINHQYDIIANISVEDDLINGAECCVKYIQPQQNKPNSQQQYGSSLKILTLVSNNTRNISTFINLIKSVQTGHQSLYTKGLSW